MRLFIAINLSSPIRDALINARNEMFDRGVRGNFTSEENLHLTLAFIGEYPDPEAVLEALSEVEFTPFPISLDGVGSFGDLWWAGLQSSAPLEAAVRRIRRALAEHDIPFDRKRFSPHITLVRKASKNMPGLRLRDAGMTVDTIALMRSDRGRSGMIYTELGTIEAKNV